MKILGINYKINIKPAFDRSELNHGSTDFLNSEINLCDILNEDSKNSTLLHEIVHALDFTMGIELSETQITAISSGIFAVCKENGISTKWVKK